MENHRPLSRSTNFATRKEPATELAIAALGFIAADAERLGRFLSGGARRQAGCRIAVC
jgi:hypothetical protein